jgi:hypothetical protein
MTKHSTRKRRRAAESASPFISLPDPERSSRIEFQKRGDAEEIEGRKEAGKEERKQGFKP